MFRHFLRAAAASLSFLLLGCLTEGEKPDPLNESMGLEWTAHPSLEHEGDDFTPYGVAWMKGLFVAVGHSGRIATSPDGAEWTFRNSGTTARLFRVASSGNQLLAAGDGLLAFSGNGIDWQVYADSTDGAEDVVWAGKKWVVAGFSGSMTSSDGKKWSFKRDYSLGITKLIWTGKLLIGLTRDSIKTSADGLNWTSRLGGSGEFWSALAWTGSRAVVVGVDGVRTSQDGITWSEAKPLNGHPTELLWTGNRLLAFSGNKVLLSDDGEAWTSRSLPFSGNVWRAAASRQVVVAFNGSQFVTSP